MTSAYFDQNFQADFQLTERDQKVHELARRYHELTEAYDRTVCTGPIRDDGVLPANYRELGKINMNARDVWKRTMSEAESNGISRQEMARAIRRYHNQ